LTSLAFFAPSRQSVVYLIISTSLAFPLLITYNSIRVVIACFLSEKAWTMIF